jgi:hypothetical protein
MSHREHQHVLMITIAVLALVAGIWIAVQTLT